MRAHTHLAPARELDVRVLWQVRDLIRNLQYASVECGQRQRSGRGCRAGGITFLYRDGVPQQALLHHLIYTETKHGPVHQSFCSQSEIRHQTLQKKESHGGHLFMHSFITFPSLHHGTVCDLL